MSCWASTRARITDTTASLLAILEIRPIVFDIRSQGGMSSFVAVGIAIRAASSNDKATARITKLQRTVDVFRILVDFYNRRSSPSLIDNVVVDAAGGTRIPRLAEAYLRLVVGDATDVQSVPELDVLAVAARAVARTIIFDGLVRASRYDAGGRERVDELGALSGAHPLDSGAKSVVEVGCFGVVKDVIEKRGRFRSGNREGGGIGGATSRNRRSAQRGTGLGIRHSGHGNQ